MSNGELRTAVLIAVIVSLLVAYFAFKIHMLLPGLTI